MFPLKIAESQQQKWALIISLNPGGPNGGSGTQYFIGDFDGERFMPDHTDELWLDHGPDNYAGVTWSDVPKRDGRRILIAWMSNWHYANSVPTDPWRGAMTVPRELSLIETSRGLRLACTPIREFESLRNASWSLENLAVENSVHLYDQATSSAAIDVEFVVDHALSSGDWQFRFFNHQDEELVLSFKDSCHEIEVNRQRAAMDMGEEGDFCRIIKVPYELDERQEISLRIIKDTSSIEVFSGGGHSLLSVIYFVDEPLNCIDLQAPGVDDRLILKQMTIHELKSIWHRESDAEANA